jgi:trk system potassium uptake protein TrkH
MILRKNNSLPAAHPLPAFPARLTAVLFAFLPVLNICIFIISDPRGFLGTSRQVTFGGALLFYGFAFANLAGVLLFRRWQLAAKTILVISCGVLALIFIAIDTDAYLSQLLVIFGCLFLIMFTMNYRQKKEPKESSWRFAGILHNLILLLMVLFLLRYDLSSLFWYRTSLSLHSAVVLLGLTWLHVRIFKQLSFRWGLAMVGFVGLGEALVIFIPPLGIFLILILTLILLWKFLVYIGYGTYLINLLFDDPFKLLVVSFAVIILLGTMILSMPAASTSGESISLIDSLFTATSATCVTGLIVLDTPQDFTLFGQVVILVLIQVGGVGIVTIMTFVGVLLGQSVGISGEYAVSEIVGSQRPRVVYDIVKFIMLFTFIVETIGAFILALTFQAQSPAGSSNVWLGIFHSISAFCNAGFSLFSDSLVSFNDTLVVPLTIALLVIIGGLGFSVLGFLRGLFRTGALPRRLPVITKVTLQFTLILLVTGYLFFLVAEPDHSLASLSGGARHVNAFFLSVTARTAGFNALPMELLSNASQVLLWVLMFIGAGSGSTAGGIKITTLAVLVAVILSHIKGRPQAALFGRELPADTIWRATMLFVLAVVLICGATVILQVNQELPLEKTVFEVISAFGTVGLSLGITPQLESFSKFIIVVLMFVGRVGPLTMLAVLARGSHRHGRYPEETIMIG